MAYTLDLTAPDTATVGEPIDFELEVCCDDPNGCRDAEFFLSLGGQRIARAGASFTGSFCIPYTLANEPASAPIDTSDGELVVTEPGTYTFSYRDGSQDITVEPAPEPSFSHDGCSIADSTITEGGSTTVTATVSNTGNADGDATVAVSVAGSQVGQETQTVPAGDTRDYSFTVQINTTGDIPISTSLI